MSEKLRRSESSELNYDGSGGGAFAQVEIQDALFWDILPNLMKGHYKMAKAEKGMVKIVDPATDKVVLLVPRMDFAQMWAWKLTEMEGRKEVAFWLEEILPGLNPGGKYKLEWLDKGTNVKVVDSRDGRIVALRDADFFKEIRMVHSIYEDALKDIPVEPYPDTH